MNSLPAINQPPTADNQWFHSFSQRFRDRQADAATTNQTKPQVFIQKALDHVISLQRFKVHSAEQPER